MYLFVAILPASDCWLSVLAAGLLLVSQGHVTYHLSHQTVD